MDIFRYFHPHHNPRLRSVPLRLQEVAELEQAALELKKALQRAQIRTESSPVEPIHGEHFNEIISAMHYVLDSLHTLHEAHPGDDFETVARLLEERKNTPGWENWVRLLQERMHLNPTMSEEHGVPVHEEY